MNVWPHSLRRILENLQPRILIGQAGLTACYALFLFEVIELAGFNLLRIVYALGAFTTFSLFLLALTRYAWIRIVAAMGFFLLVWANLLHYRYFGSSIPLGSIYNIGFLPYLDTEIYRLARAKDIIILLLLPVAIIPLRSNLFAKRGAAARGGALLLGLYAAMVLFQFFTETQSTVNRVRKYGINETRLQIYLSNRLHSEDHLGSILQFGFIWTYFSDYLRLGGSKPPLEEIPLGNLVFIAAGARTPNIVVIEVEALDREIIGYTHQGQPVTPYLNRLAENQIFFNNIYAQHSSAGGTSDGDFCFLTSQYPLGYKGSLGAVGLEKLPSVPRVLAANRYSTMAFHAHQGSLYRRREGFSKLGFAGLYFKEHFQIDDPDRWHTLKDRDFFNQVIEIIAAAPEPFFAYIITLSSHSPFDLIGVEDYTSSFQSESSLVQNYFNSMHYVDAALEMLITELQARYPDTVFMLFGDHTSNLRTNEYTSTDDPKIHPIPVIIIDPQFSGPALYSQPGTTIDLAPTLFDLLDFDPPAFWQGYSLLSPPDHFIPVILIDSDYYIDSLGAIQRISSDYPDLTATKRIRRYIR